MNILISNDDGYLAKGINSLNESLMSIAQTTIIAPDKERSSCGHGISLGEPVRLKKIEENIFACSGLPADCILVGIGSMFKDDKPDLVVSGINHGANLGQDRYYSGTIAAAREAAFRGIRSISVSLVNNNYKEVEFFASAASFVKECIHNNIYKKIPEMCVLNINYPNVAMENIAGIKFTFAGFQNYTEEIIQRVDSRGKEYYWIGGTHTGFTSVKGSDCNAISENFITLDLQNYSWKELETSVLDSFIQSLSKIKWENNLQFTHY